MQFFTFLRRLREHSRQVYPYRIVSYRIVSYRITAPYNTFNVNKIGNNPRLQVFQVETIYHLY